MSRSVRIEEADGAPVMVCEASATDAARLRAEAERLRTAAHPGVVRVLSSDGGLDRWVLRTAHAGRPLDVGPRLAPEALAAVVVVVATTLADLHEIGVVHGRLRAGHILIGPAGRPVLCGLGAADDPQRSADPADDVAALGQIVVDHLAGDQPLEPIPERRWSRRRHWSGWARTTLLTLADQACAAEPGHRPTARRLAATIAETFDVSLDDQTEHLDPLDALRRTVTDPTADARPRWAGALGTLALVLGAWLVVRGLVGGAPTPARVTGDAAPVIDAASPIPPSTRADQPIRVDGTLVTTAHGRFEVGRPGDVVTIGDWNCDGIATPAALRVGTGEVFVFPSWAEGGELAVRALRAIPGAVDLVATDGHDGCSTLQVELAAGGVVGITEAGAP